MYDLIVLFKFEEYDVYLLMQVIEELDNGKKGIIEVSCNVCQVSCFFNELVQVLGLDNFVDGILLQCLNGLQLCGKQSVGLLCFQISYFEVGKSFGVVILDNVIFGVILVLKEQILEILVVFVFKDINLWIKVVIVGIVLEDYENDCVLDDFSLFYIGVIELLEDFWKKYIDNFCSWSDKGCISYEIFVSDDESWYFNQYVYLFGDDEVELCVVKVDGDKVILLLVNDFCYGSYVVWGISVCNCEQNFVFNVLMDLEIDFVILLGIVGIGKILFVFVVGLVQMMDQQCYCEIIMICVMVSVGEDIGFLFGIEEEKMMLWMGVLIDNLEVFIYIQEGGVWGCVVINDLIVSWIKICLLNFMCGCIFLLCYLILDEVQNFIFKQMKMLIICVGFGIKIVCLGNVEQIDILYLIEIILGLIYVVDCFKNWLYSVYVMLCCGECLCLVDYVLEVL